MFQLLNSFSRFGALLVIYGLFFGTLIIFPMDSSAQVRSERTRGVERPADGRRTIQDLKDSGTYDSLVEAFKKSTGSDAPSLLPGGTLDNTEVKLVSPSAGTGHRFGTAVDIYGDTAVIGAPGEGTAKVFVRSGGNWSFQQSLGDFPSDLLGNTVSIYGNTIAVGLPEWGGDNEGRVNVYTRTGSTWSFRQQLSPDGSCCKFGESVAVFENRIVVGQPNRGSGAVFVFDFDGAATWNRTQILFHSANTGFDKLGFSVDTWGDTIVAGAPQADESGSRWDQGVAIVFRLSGGTWSQEARLAEVNGIAGDNAGHSVAIHGDTVAVGAPYDDRDASNLSSAADAGAAYVFKRSGTTWTRQQKLVASDREAGDRFGWSVSIYGQNLLVGARYDQIGSEPIQGSAYFFQFDGIIWASKAKIIASDGNFWDDAGDSVGVFGDTLLVGASYDDTTGADRGAVRVYQTRITSEKEVASDGSAWDVLGTSIATDGLTAVVGAPYDDVGANADQGSVYVFVRNGHTWSLQTKLTASDGRAGDKFGGSISISGDRVVVGAEDHDLQSSNEGAAYVFLRTGTTWAQQAKLTASDFGHGRKFGRSVGISGSTIVVGTSTDGVGVGVGEAYIFTRSGSIWTEQTSFVAATSGTNFGNNVAISGDTVVVGASYDDISLVDQGAAYVFVRSGGVWSQQAQLTASDAAQYDEFGLRVSISGDSIVVGAWAADVSGKSNQGAAYVFTRSGGNWTQQQKLTAFDGAANDNFGIAVSISDDTLIVGAASHTASITGQGAAYLFSRAGTDWTFQRKLIATDAGTWDMFGTAVAVDGQTAVVGAPYTASNKGGAYMHYWGSLAPTAAGATVSGRLLDESGRGLRNASVVLTDSMGIERVVTTGTFGRFVFSDVPSGDTYLISVRSRRFVFGTEVLNLQSDLTGLTLQPLGRRGR